ncbi:hypothetical protein BCR44DRAFT_1432151 [Catenaria anguillulae PL171]|uniref:Uncharacterized protein n=1 Tax=Catenaria anguillulae PL171 TaxID=765915 RepID=A0A1Y2HPN2_9FUNG|nr:hypothetical protein BCR44DRAFT_1442199 [Catenaria anguillulae PL171]ORZ36568.1 hypothetical protein BCR44DRAFT_1432151 [Catenaria anguillulae PL171]
MDGSDSLCLQQHTVHGCMEGTMQEDCQYPTNSAATGTSQQRSSTATTHRARSHTSWCVPNMPRATRPTCLLLCK